MTQDLINQLSESSSQKVISIQSFRELDNFKVIVPKLIKSGSHVIVDETTSLTFMEVTALKLRVGPCLGIAVAANIPFGFHPWSIEYSIPSLVSPSSTTSISESAIPINTIYTTKHHGYMFVTSDLYNFLHQSRDVMDEIVWGWSYGGEFNDALEGSLLELLIATNDELQQTLVSWKSMMPGFSGMMQETTRLHTMIREDIETALTQKVNAGYAVGRLHQNLLQLLESGSQMLGLPDIFTNAAKAFIVNKVKLSPRETLLQKLKHLLPFMTPYLETHCGHMDLESTRLSRSMAVIQSALNASPAEFSGTAGAHSSIRQTMQIMLLYVYICFLYILCV